MAWAFATLIKLDEQVLAALALEAKLRMSEFNVQDFASMTWALATLIKLDEQVFAALALEAKLRMSEFNYRNSPTRPGHSRR